VGHRCGREPGGLIGLYGLVSEHCEAVEADLAFRGIDLRGLWTGELSWRRLKVLIDHLPPESATKTAIRDAMGEDLLIALPVDDDAAINHGPWSRLETLVALVADTVNDLSYLTLSLALDQKAKRPDPPARVPRPGVQRRPSGNRPSPAALAFLAREREERRHHLSLVQDGG
jgi:hypothetical protein